MNLVSNVVLIKANDESRGVKSLPLGLIYVGSLLEHLGKTVKVLDLFPSETDQAISTIEDLDPTWVGFSFMTGPPVGATVEVAREVQKLDVFMLCGGVHPTLRPKECSLFDGSWQGACGKIEDDLPLNYALVDVERYLFQDRQVRRGIHFTGSMGCPNACGFCSNEIVHKRRWRSHSVGFVIETIDRLRKEFGIDGVHFWDDNFFANKKWAYEIARQMPVPWTASAHIEQVDEEFVDVLARSECHGLVFGLESGSDRVLKLIGKKTTRRSILEKSLMMKDLKGFRLSASVIFGYPTETFNEFKETLSLISDLMDKMPEMAFTCGRFLPYPGTRSYELAVERGFQEPKRLEDWSGFDRWVDGPTPWLEWSESKSIWKFRRYVQVGQFLSRKKIFGHGFIRWLIRRGRESWVLDGLSWVRGILKRWRG